MNSTVMPSILEEEKSALDKVIHFAQSQKLPISRGWHNQAGTVKNPKALAIQIHSDQELSLLWKFINELNQSLPEDQATLSAGAASGGTGEYYHDSFSLTENIANYDIVLHLVGKNHLHPRIANEKDRQNCLITVGANTQVETVDQFAWDEGFTDIATTHIHKIGYVGALSNGAHDTGIGEHAEFKTQRAHDEEIKALIAMGTTVPNTVPEIKITAPNGDILTLHKDHPTFGGKFFETMRSAPMGLFGPISEIKMQFRPAVKLHKVDLAINIYQLKEMIRNGLFFDKKEVSYIYFCRYLFNEKPGYNEDEPHAKANVLLTYLTPEAPAIPNLHNHPELDTLELEPLVRMSNFTHLPALMSKHNEFIPIYTNLTADLEVIAKAGEMIGPSNEARHPLKGYPKNISDIDCLVPFSFSGEKKNICQPALDNIDFLMLRLREYFAKKQYPLLQAMYTRVLGRSYGGLSLTTQNPDEYTLATDFVSADHVPGWRETYDTNGTVIDEGLMKKLVVFMLSAPYNGKAHWGKTVLINGEFPVPNYLDRFGQGLNDYLDCLKLWCKTYNIKLERYAAINPYLRKMFGEKLGLKPMPLKAAYNTLEEKVSTDDIIKTIEAGISALRKQVLKNPEHASIHDRVYNFISIVEGISSQLKPETSKPHPNKMFSATSGVKIEIIDDKKKKPEKTSGSKFRFACCSSN